MKLRTIQGEIFATYAFHMMVKLVEKVQLLMCVLTFDEEMADTLVSYNLS